MSRMNNMIAGSNRINQHAGSLGMFLDDDFDQDDLSGRYGNSRDRQVPEKLRLNRSKPRRWVGTVSAK